MSEMPPGLAAELETLQRKHAQYPEGRYFVPLANARRKAGDLDQAETLLREGMEIHPEYLSAYIVLGRCLEDRGDAAEAEEQFKRVLSRDPQNLVALQHLGEIAARDGRREDAAHWYQELIGADPMNDGARARLAELEAEEPAAVVSETAEEDQRWEGEGGLAREDGDFEEPGPEEDVEGIAGGEPAWIDTEERLIDAGDHEGSLTEYERAGEPSFEEAPGDDEVHAGVEEREASEPEAELANGGRSEVDRGEEAPFEPAETDHEEPWAAPLEVEDDAVGMGPAESVPTAPDEEVEVGVVTETIASIYARQGLYDRAAAVYRKLIEARGDEPHLRERLAEVERALADRDRPEAEASILDPEEAETLPAPAEEIAGDEGRAGSGEGRYAFPEPSSEEDPSAEGEPGDTAPEEGGADLWTTEEEETDLVEAVGSVGAEDFSTAVVGAGDPDAEREPSAEEDVAESIPIGSYLRGLLAWAPPHVPEENASDEPAAEGREDSAGSGLSGGATSDDAEADVEAVESEGANAVDPHDAWDGTPDSFSTEGLVDELHDPASQAAEENTDRAGSAPGDEEELWLAPPPEEEPAPEPSGSNEAEGDRSVGTPADRDDTGRGKAISRSGGEAAAEEPDRSGSRQEDSGPAAHEEAKDDRKERTDDDLQSFQAWLKSLKR